MTAWHDDTAWHENMECLRLRPNLEYDAVIPIEHHAQLFKGLAKIFWQAVHQAVFPRLFINCDPFEQFQPQLAILCRLTTKSVYSILGKPLDLLFGYIYDSLLPHFNSSCSPFYPFDELLDEQ